MGILFFIMLNVVAFGYAECDNPALAGKDVPEWCGPAAKEAAAANRR